MNTTVEALKGLYVVLGGQLTDTYTDIAGGIAVSDYVLIPDMIQAITQKATSGGSGSSLFVINITEDAEYEITLDKTYAQIEAAYNSGARLVVNVTSANGNFNGWENIPLNNAMIQDDHPTLNFCPINVGDGVTDIGLIQLNCGTEFTTINTNKIS